MHTFSKIYPEKEEMYYQCLNWILRNGFKRILLLVGNKQCEKEFYEYCSKRKVPISRQIFTKKNGIIISEIGVDNAINDIDALGVLCVHDIESNSSIQRYNSIPSICLDYSGKEKLPAKNKKKYLQENLHLKNEKIYKQFLDTFEVAETEINIISPWINRMVVDDELIGRLQECLLRGVKIRIIYGLGDDTRAEGSRFIARELKKMFSGFSNLFFIEEKNTHSKLLLCDEKYMMIGSYNFLSFKGTYDGNDCREESVEYIVSKEKIREIRRSYFDND